MRTQANGIRIPDSPRPQIWDPEIVGHWRRWAKLRTQLYPYLAAAEREYRASGLPIMRHLVLAYPRDRRAAGVEDEFLFGPSLLAAPVLEPGATRRRAYLPRGRWVDLWRSASYRDSDGGLSLGRPRLLRGGRAVTLPAPLGELPLLARAGALLALLPPDVDTLAAYGDRSASISLAERERRRVLLAFPRGTSSAALEDGGALRSVERPGEWSLTVHSSRARSWEIQASLGALRNRLRPCRVSARGGRVERWRFDRRTRVLTATLSARDATLTARACRR
jgi:alpha-glucosidase (family GH31 glycosyl hydrolase)